MHHREPCATGFCVDGVCCDTLCAGQCQACDIAGAEGKCLGVTGAPHGARPACSDGGADVCKALTCDGSRDLNKCASFSHGLDFECAESCTDGTVSKSFCDGTGVCKAPESTTCAGFACDGKVCKTVCTAATDCAAGFSCSPLGKCESVKATCSDDGGSSIPIDGTPPTACSPYLCERARGACYAQCTSSDQCVSGYLCNEGQCFAPAGADSGENGGCATTKHARAARRSRSCSSEQGSRRARVVDRAPDPSQIDSRRGLLSPYPRTVEVLQRIGHVASVIGLL